MRILVVYGTSFGSTADIAEHIADRLREQRAQVLVVDVHSLRPGVDAARFEAIVVGGRVWGNRYPGRMVRFVRENLEALRSRPSAFFSVGLWSVSRIAGHREQAQEVPRRFLEQVDWKPDRVEVFAGALPFSRYGFGLGFLGRRLMRAIWRADLGPLDIGRDYVFTDWAEVDAFADSFLMAATSVTGPTAEGAAPPPP